MSALRELDEMWLDKAMEKGRIEGFQQGFQQGRRQAELEMVRKLVRILNKDLISRFTNLTLAEIEELKSS